MRDILDLVKPMTAARYAVFYSLADGADGGRYYDVHKLENMRHELTILAYEMNGRRSASCTARRCGCAARTSWVSRWSSGSEQSNSFTTSRSRRRPRRLQRGPRILWLPNADLIAPCDRHADRDARPATRATQELERRSSRIYCHARSNVWQ